MTSGERRVPRRGVLVLGPLLLGDPAMALADPAPQTLLDQLMERLAGVAESHASFVELKHIRALTKPLESSGRLVYVRPAYLAMITEHPVQEKLVIDGDRLFIAEGNAAARMIDLADQPEIRALVETIRGTLAGDLDSLRRLFVVSIAGSLSAWQLTLVPVGAATRHLLREVRITGTGSTLATVTILQANGNDTRITVRNPP
jgi:outer membrane lipoprotein-sorting protein